MKNNNINRQFTCNMQSYSACGVEQNGMETNRVEWTPFDRSEWDIMEIGKHGE